MSVISFQVNVPKQRKTFCKGKNCKKHTLHKVTQYKKGRDSIHVQGKVDSLYFGQNFYQIFNIMILSLKTGVYRRANTAYPDQTASTGSLIRVFTVCSSI